MKVGINVNAWKRKTEAAKRKVQSSATVYVRAQAKKVWLEAVRVSPQWSGNYAYNWVLEVRSTPRGYDPRFKVTPWQALKSPKQAGNVDTIRAALQFVDEMLEPIKWNSQVRLVNYAPVAPLIESGQVTLRPENLIPGGYGVIKYLETKYKYLRA